MKKVFLLIVLFVCSQTLFAQDDCDELIEYLTTNYNGRAYANPSSSSIEEVVFYSYYDDNATYYYAIVEFTTSYDKFVYQVDNLTEDDYAENYSESAGRAYWDYIEPHKDFLGCE